MSRIDILKKRQDMLKEEITALLDSFLIGTVAKSPEHNCPHLDWMSRRWVLGEYRRAEGNI